MANVAPQFGSRTTEHRAHWMFALVTTSLVTAAGLVVAVQQFVLKFLWDQSAHTRTIGGMFYMLLGVIGICLPILLIRHKRRFLSLQPSRQLLIAVGAPLAYILLFALCIEVSLRSTRIVLRRPFVPTAVVRHQPGDSQVEFQGGWKPRLESGSNDSETAAGVEHFSSHLYQGFLRHPSRETITIVGRGKLLDDGLAQITLDVDAKERVRFAVENLENVEIRRDGQRIDAADSQLGEYQVTITGRPIKDI